MKYSFSAVFSAVAALVLYTSFVNASPERWTFDATPVTGPCEAKFISGSKGLDSPMLSCINSTVADWWYFDVVSLDLQESFVIVFYLTTDGSFPFIDDTANIVPTIGIWSELSNGTLLTYILNATEAVISSSQSGQGDYYETGASWSTSTDDYSAYTVKIDSPSAGVFGTFELKSVAPSHYPCGPNEAGQNMMVGPHIGWSNAVPDAIGTVDFTFQGTKMEFTGVAYHDSNWSDQPFLDTVGSWYWGHGRIGDYSIVWFDFLALNGTEYLSSYVSHSGTIITASCAANSIKVRPTGFNSLYPPTQTSGSPEGFNVTFELSNGGSGFLNVTGSKIVAGGDGVYTRWVGSMVGEINGEVLTDGVALFEAFALT